MPNPYNYSAAASEGTTEPVGTIKAFAKNSIIPKDYLILDGAMLLTSAYDKLYLIFKDNFNTDDTPNGYFNLPDLTDKGLWGADENSIGKYIDASLPNITGNVENLRGGSSTGGSEAFAVTKDVSAAGYVNNTVPHVLRSFNFNAARSSSIYNDSGKMRPPSLGVYFAVKAI